MSKITYRCPECGSKDVESDASAKWNDETQAWEFCGVYDIVTCESCGYASSYRFEVELEE